MKLLTTILILLLIPCASGMEFSGIVDMSEPICIRDQDVWMHDATFIGSHNSYSYICLSNCTLNATNCVFADLGIDESGKYGLSLYKVYDSHIENCSFTNMYRGLHIQECSNIMISNSYIGNCTDYGFNLHGNITRGWYSEYITLINCTSFNNDHHGVTLSQNVCNCAVRNCTIVNNDNSGIILDQSSNNNTIIGCNIIGNGDYGIAIYDSEESHLIDNNIRDNGRCAIYDRDRRIVIRPWHILVLVILTIVVVRKMNIRKYIRGDK